MLLLLAACSTTPSSDADSDRPDPQDSAPADTADSAPPDTADSTSSDTADTSPDTADTSPDTADTAPVEIAADHPSLRYVGRISSPDPTAAELYWAGSAVRATFEGTSLSVTLDDRGENWVNVLVDGAEPVVLDCEPGLHTYVVAEGLADGTHTVELNRRTEPHEGVVAFVGLTLDPGRGLGPPPTPPALRIEFFGDSITSGMSNESTCDCDDPAYKNNYLSYAALTARALGADHHTISLSGVGIVRSWWPATIHDYWDSYQDVDHAWDFGLWTPDIVVVNLGQNDKWLGVGEEITLAYVDFVRDVRAVYPDAHIFLALGSMDAVAPGSPFPEFVETAVARLNEADPRVHAVIFAYNGTGAHPLVADHEQMADTLVAAIREAVPELP